MDATMSVHIYAFECMLLCVYMYVCAVHVHRHVGFVCKCVCKYSELRL